MTKLFIVGHGMQRNNIFDPGAIGLIAKGEHKYIAEDLVPAMKKYLPEGHDVVFFDEYKVSNYGNIVALAKKYKATQVIELHYDSSTNPDARGGHVIIYEGFAPDKIDLAFRDAINNVVGARKSYNHKGHVGISGRNNLLNVNQMANAGISYRLLELGFGSGKRDSDIMINRVDEYAKELVKAIIGVVVENDGWKKSDSQWRFYKNGKSVTGWLKDNNKWYYLNASGVMQTGWQKVIGNWYYLNSDGSMATGWKFVDNKWYLLNDSGAMQTGWQKVNGKWYILADNGAMYEFDKSGALIE